MKQLICLFFISMLFFSCREKKSIDDIQKEMKANVGNIYVIGRDTSMIVDYNSFLCEYTLSNGAKCDISLIEKLTPIK